MSKVKRYWPEEIVGTGELVVYAQDYAVLEAQCKILRNSLAGSNNQARANKLEAEKFAIDWLKVLEERDTLAAELAAIKGQKPVAFYWQDIGYPEPRKHGPYFGWPSESALRNVDGGAIPVPLYTLPPASHDQEGT